MSAPVASNALYYGDNLNVLRESIRKVTGGLRAQWGAKVYAAAASVIATGRLHGLTAFEALRAALAGQPVMRPA